MPSTIAAGTTAGTAIAISGDTTGNLAFQTNGTTTAMTIDTSQNVGIGISSPGQKLDVNGQVKFQASSSGRYFQFINDSSASYLDASHALNLRVNGASSLATAATLTTGGDFQFNSGYGSVATAYGCRAWANFNGTNAGTITPRASGNITSLTKNTTGDYTANFTNAMPDANYAVLLTTGGTGNSFWFRTYDDATPRTASAFRFITVRFNDGANQDAAQVGLAVFR